MYNIRSTTPMTPIDGHVDIDFADRRGWTENMGATILPIMIWSTITFFRALPPDIEEAAAMDGATVWQLFFRVIIPLSAPVLLTNGLLVFVTMWSEYLLVREGRSRTAIIASGPVPGAATASHARRLGQDRGNRSSRCR